MVHDGQGGDTAVREDRQGHDERRVGVDVGDVGVRSYSKFFQSLLHEGRHRHLTHLKHTDTEFSFQVSREKPAIITKML